MGGAKTSQGRDGCPLSSWDPIPGLGSCDLTRGHAPEQVNLPPPEAAGLCLPPTCPRTLRGGGSSQM